VLLQETTAKILQKTINKMEGRTCRPIYILKPGLHPRQGGVGRRPGAYLSAVRRVGTYFKDTDVKQKLL
jgi:hypothetical protein